MTDLELTKACAEAMRFSVDEQTTATISYRNEGHIWIGQSIPGYAYGPLHDDAQAMALVKKFKLALSWDDIWCCDGSRNRDNNSDVIFDDNLNRAIVECVAKMHTASDHPPR